MVDKDSTAFKIPLTRGRFAIVDEADLWHLSQWKWTLQVADKTSYAMRMAGGRKKLYMHRVIMDAKRGSMVDHANGNGLDNRRSNLRFCSATGNARNKGLTGGSSRFKGVSWSRRRNKWVAYIGVDYRCIYLGQFDVETEAAEAYNRAAINHFGEFVRLNEIAS